MISSKFTFLKIRLEYTDPVKMNKKYLVLIPLVLSSFIHFMNPVGFPDIFFDEGIYMRRALNTIETGNPQESYLYDHPYFGQILLAGVLQITNHTNIEPSTDPEDLRNLYLIPRIFMGLLATVNAFLVYLIAKEKFGQNVALLSAILFSVMPYTWIFNRILLDSLLLPFLLGSILTALWFSKQEGGVWLAPISGIMLGLAIFTKVPAFVFIPLVIWIVFQKRRNFQDLLIWIVPVLLIPLLWPANSIILGQFDLWIKDVLWQTQRTNSIFEIVQDFLIIDPVLFVIGIAGIAYAGIKRNKFVLFWFVPFVLFLSIIGFKQYFHWIPIIPILCIGASICLLDIPKNINKLKSKQIHKVIIGIILVFGFSNTLLLFTNDISYNQFDALSYVLENPDETSTILAGPVYSWILYDVFDWKNVPLDYSVVLFYPIETDSIVVIADPHFMFDQNRGEKIRKVYSDTNSLREFKGVVMDFDSQIYPYTNMKMNMEAGPIDIRKGNWD